MILRRFIILIGGVFPRLRIAFEKRYYRKHIEKIRSEDYRFIIPHHIADGLAAVESGIPFLFHSHEYLPLQFDRDWLFRFTEIRYRFLALKKILQKAVLIVVEGDKVARKYSQEFRIPLENFIVMPSMPKYHTFNDAKKGNDLDEVAVPIKLIHHGNIFPERGIELLVDIVSVLGPTHQLTLMGSGPNKYLTALKLRASAFGNITVRDPVPYVDIVETLHGHDLGLVVFGSPHYHHKYMTVPNKFWECLQARVPVLVSPDSAMAELIRNSGCGIVAESATLDGYVNAIQSLTPQDYTKMKARCEALAWNHSRDSWISSYGERVEKVIDSYYQKDYHEN